MRNMSFSMTEAQMRDKSKTVTRRFGWAFIKPGDLVMACVKTMGLKKGEKMDRIGPIRILSTRWEPLNAITKEDCIKEGFPDMEPADFVAMLLVAYPKKFKVSSVNRIEFEHVYICEDCGDITNDPNEFFTDYSCTTCAHSVAYWDGL